ncbi:MAG: hypothetical protein ACK41E_03600, partial [Deinococcales bacterium]
MLPLLEIRLAHYPEDYPAIVEVYNSVADWQSKVETVALDDQIRNPELHFVRYVAEILENNHKKIVAVLELGHNSRSHEAGKYFVEIDVHKAYWRRGIA